MQLTEWILCPICRSKTRDKIRPDTELKHFPLFCPKCKKETLINVKDRQMYIVTEPAAKTQSQ
ncbi:MAG: cysteine-rich KTR domain-containing protein [Butyricicoccus sp.]